MSVSLVPFPKLHFLTLNQAPLLAARNIGTNLKVDELTYKLWNNSHCLAKINTENGKYLTGCQITRDRHFSAVQECEETTF